MKPTRITLRTEKHKRYAADLVGAVPLFPVHELLISEQSDAYTAAQRRLYFKWIGFIAQHTGATKDEIHVELKCQILTEIYARDDAAFASWWAEQKKLGYEHMMRSVDKAVSLTDAKKRQMKEYMDDVFRFATVELGLRLPYEEEQR